MKNTTKSKQTILVVDDNAMNRALLDDMLNENYEILEADSGESAIAALQRYGVGISLMLLDKVMEGMSGLDVLRAMNKQGWIKSIPVIMITSDQTPGTKNEALDLGVSDFITRPFDAAIVQRRVSNSLMLYAKQSELADMVEEQIRERERSTSTMITILSHVVEFRNGESGSHVKNVRTITEMLLRRMTEKTDEFGLTPADIATISMASSLHDIGKISIPEDVLNKPGKLTDAEFDLMKRHTVIGSDMLESLSEYDNDPLVETARAICRWHHERYDGRGYPDGLVGDECPISAQAVALADVYDALTSKRVYKPAFSHEKSLDMILGGECGTFNPKLLECLTDIADDIHARLDEIAAAADGGAKKAKAGAAQSVNKSSYVYTTLQLDVASNTKLDLLEYERIKHQFYAMMSNEIQFEFTVDPPLAVVSDWGRNKIGLPSVVTDPYHDKTIRQMIPEEALKKLHDSLRQTTPENPIVQFDFQANIDGSPRWFNLAARALWGEGDDGKPDYKGSIGKFVDIQENREIMTDLERRATQDSLTGLYNHAYARKLIIENFKEFPEDTFVMMVLDMDNFKGVNDTRGHLFGDDVLCELARRLHESVRERDIVARVGGDEFLVCMHFSCEVEPLVERVYHSLLGEHDGYDITVSMGVVYERGASADYETMFSRADHALYIMKRTGRGGFLYASAAIDADDGFSSSVSAIESNSEDDATSKA